MEDSLLRERWVGRLAAALTGDLDDADDLIQTARVALWRRPPTDLGRLRAWLRVLLRNTSLNRRRDKGRQRARALAAQLEPQEVPVDPETSLERLRWHQTVTKLVVVLDEPLRQTILMRYFEGKNSAEIATAMGVPAGTVRWRLKTGIDRLRAQLDEQPGGHARWHEALSLILVNPLDVPTVSLRTTGPRDDAPIPSRRTGWNPKVHAWGLWAILVAAAAIVLWIGIKSKGSHTATVGTFAAQSGDHEGLVAAHDTPRAGPPRLLHVGEGTNAQDTPIPSWARVEGKPDQIVAGRVLSGGRPVSGAQARLSLGPATFARHLDRHAGTDDHGRFNFGSQAESNWFLTVSAPGLAQEIRYVDLRLRPVRVDPGQHPADDITVVLEPCIVNVRGTVHDEAGVPIPGANIRITGSWNNGGEPVAVDKTGAFELCAPNQAAPGARRVLVVQAPGYGTVETLLQELPAKFDIKMQMAAKIAGQVLASEDGTPLPGARVTAHPNGPSDPNHVPIGKFQAVRIETMTDQEGRFEIADLAAGSFLLHASATGRAVLGDDPMVTIGEGEQRTNLKLRLPLARRIKGQVLRMGVPVPDQSIWFQSQADDGHWSDIAWTMSDAQGNFEEFFPLGAVIHRVLVPQKNPKPPWPRALGPWPLTINKDAPVSLRLDMDDRSK